MRASYRIALFSIWVLSLLLTSSVLSVHNHAIFKTGNNTPTGSLSQRDGLTQAIPVNSPPSASGDTGHIRYSSTQTSPSSSSSFQKSWQTLPFSSHGTAVKSLGNVNVLKSGTREYMPMDSVGISTKPQPNTTASSVQGYANPGDGFCGQGITPCGNVAYQGGFVMHQAQFVIQVWAGCGSDGCYDVCNGQHLFEPSGGDAADCHYIFLQELFLQDFCDEGGIGPGGLFAVINQYTDGTGTGLGSCSLQGGSASESSGGFSVNYVYDPTPFPDDGDNCGGVTPCLSDYDIQQSAARAANFVGDSCIPDGIQCEVLVLIPFNVCQDGFCPQTNISKFCAYHSVSVLTQTAPNILMYASMPVAASFATTAFGCPTSPLPSTPTGDPIGDLEVNTLSHESIETMTDPMGTSGGLFGSGYYFPTTQCDSAGNCSPYNAEIADECNFDFREKEPDNSTVHLGVNGDPFLIQPEWSNVNGGCTFDLAGAPAQTVITLTPDTSTGTAATWPSGGFPIIFQEAGEGPGLLPSFTLLFLGCCSGVMIIFVTPDGGPDFNNLYIDPVVNVPVVNAPEDWCFDANCSGPPPTYVSGPAFVQYVFYDLLAQHPYVCFHPTTIVCSPPPSSFGTNGFTVNLQYTTAPSSAGNIDTTQTVSLTLGTIPNNFMALAVNGSEASWPNCTPFNNSLGFSCGNAGERYSNGGVCTSLLDCSTSRAVTSADSITNLDYWDQYLVPVKYFTSDLSTIPSTPPSFTGMAFGVATIPLVLSTSPQNVWLDSASAWSVSPQTLAGSTSKVRWFAPVVSGFESGTNPINVVYIHQYYVIFVVGLGSGSTSPMSSWQNAGSTITIAALPAPGYKFAAWTSSTSVIRLAYYATPTTKATINGPGTITVLFHP